MSKFEEKRDKLEKAIVRLEQSLVDYDKYKIESIRDGAIQRFEFCTELVWKTLREYLIEQGYTEINSPKAVIRKAFGDGIITDEETWIRLLNDRNATSHIYNQVTAIDIFNRIKEDYVQLFKKVAHIGRSQEN